MDTLTSEQRSELMSRIRSRDTQPELRVRRLVHALGYRYRLYVGSLPGRPDLVFPGRGKAIFIHGCFWHRHLKCPMGSRVPKSRLDFWLPKLEGNGKRDLRNLRRLRRLGWSVMVVWECQTRSKRLEALTRRIVRFLGEARGRAPS